MVLDYNNTCKCPNKCVYSLILKYITFALNLKFYFYEEYRRDEYFLQDILRSQ